MSKKVDKKLRKAAREAVRNGIADDARKNYLKLKAFKIVFGGILMVNLLLLAANLFMWTRILTN